MSSILWRGNNLFQRLRGEEAHLGHVAFDDNSQTYVLWLKDPGDIVGIPFVRGDAFSTMEEAKARAATCPTAFLMHLIWMHQLRRDDDREEESDSSPHDDGDNSGIGAKIRRGGGHMMEIITSAGKKVIKAGVDAAVDKILDRVMGRPSDGQS